MLDHCNEGINRRGERQVRHTVYKLLQDTSLQVVYEMTSRVAVVRNCAIFRNIIIKNFCIFIIDYLFQKIDRFF